MADLAKLLLRMVVCKSQTSTLGLKACRTRAQIIFLTLNAIWAVHMRVTSVKNLFESLKLAPFEMQGTFMFAMRHSLLFPLKLTFLKPASLCVLYGEPIGEQLCVI